MRNFTFTFFLFLALCCASFASRASHLIGGEISYANVGPNTYLATCKIYYDCRFTIPPASVQFNLKAPGCNTGTTFSSDKQVISSQVLNPYCPAVGNSCSSNAALSLRMDTYTATFTFSQTQLQCNDWILSVKDCYRSGFVNIQDAIKTCLYLEAYMNMAANGNQLASPSFLPPANLFVTVNSPATISNLAEDQGANAPDSLVYSLIRALEDHNTPVVYAPNFSHLNPIPASAGVNLAPNTGMLSFRPTQYVNSTNPEDNAYVVMLEATAFKKINGKMTRISSAQRSLPVYIVNNAPNVNPKIVNATLNGVAVLPNSVTQVWSGSSFQFRFQTTDDNAGDSLKIYASAVPGFNFTSQGETRPHGIINWQTPVVTKNKVVYFEVSVKDNACPVQGVNTQVFGVELVANITGVKDQLQNDAGFVAFPNPFTNEVYFKWKQASKNGQIIIYNLLGQQLDQLSIDKISAVDGQIHWHKAADFPSGTYVAKLISENKTLQTLKFTKLQ